MVARYEDDGLNGRAKRGIDDEAAADPNGVDVCQHFFYNVGWQVVGAM